MKVYICDHCAYAYSEEIAATHIEVETDEGILDLCEDCYREFSEEGKVVIVCD